MPQLSCQEHAFPRSRERENEQTRVKIAAGRRSHSLNCGR